MTGKPVELIQIEGAASPPGFNHQFIRKLFMGNTSRRQFLLTLSLLAPAALASRNVFAQATDASVELPPYPAAWLPAGIRSRFVNNVNGLRIHVLEGDPDHIFRFQVVARRYRNPAFQHILLEQCFLL